MSEKISRWPTGAWYYYLEPKINKVEKREKEDETSIDYWSTSLSFTFSQIWFDKKWWSSWSQTDRRCASLSTATNKKIIKPLLGGLFFVKQCCAQQFSFQKIGPIFIVFALHFLQMKNFDKNYRPFGRQEGGIERHWQKGATIEWIRKTEGATYHTKIY